MPAHISNFDFLMVSSIVLTVLAFLILFYRGRYKGQRQMTELLAGHLKWETGESKNLAEMLATAQDINLKQLEVIQAQDQLIKALQGEAVEEETDAVS